MRLEKYGMLALFAALILPWHWLAQIGNPSPGTNPVLVTTGAALLNAVANGNSVTIPPGASITLSSSLPLKSGVSITCADWTASIFQASNLNPMIDWAPNNASNTLIQNCTIDCQNNATAASYIFSMGGSGTNNRVLNNHFQNCWVSGAITQIGGTQTFAQVKNNVYQNVYGAQVMEVFYSVVGTAGFNQIQGNICNGWGTFCIHLLRGDWNNVTGNLLKGNLKLACITITGTAVTQGVGCAGNFTQNFAGILPGNGLQVGAVGNGCVVAGPLSTVTNTTLSCVSAPAGGNVTNQPAAIGNFEGFNIDSASNNNVAVNSGTFNTEDNCMSITNIIGGGPTNDNLIAANRMGNCGGSGIQADSVNGGNIFKNALIANYISNSSQVPSPGQRNVGIRLASAGTQNNFTAVNPVIDENAVMANPIGLDSIGTGNVLGDNFSSGITSLFPRTAFTNKTGQICGGTPANPVVGTSYVTASVAFNFQITRLYGIVTSLGVAGSGNVTVNIAESGNINPTSANIAVNSAVGTGFSSGASSPINHAANTQMFIFTNADNETTRTGWNVCAEYEALAP